jgi:hypothetical protein
LLHGHFVLKLVFVKKQTNRARNCGQIPSSPFSESRQQHQSSHDHFASLLIASFFLKTFEGAICSTKNELWVFFLLRASTWQQQALFLKDSAKFAAFPL